jgi:hypothetical protein
MEAATCHVYASAGLPVLYTPSQLGSKQLPKHCDVEQVWERKDVLCDTPPFAACLYCTCRAVEAYRDTPGNMQATAASV